MWRYVEDEAKKANEATVGGQGKVGREGVRDGEDSRPEEVEEEEEEVEEEEEEEEDLRAPDAASLAPASACRSWKPKPVEQVREATGVYTLTCTLHPTVSTSNPSEAS